MKTHARIEADDETLMVTSSDVVRRVYVSVLDQADTNISHVVLTKTETEELIDGLQKALKEIRR